MNFKYDVVIGLEIHVELDTDSKLFCSCATKGSSEPNSRTCPICLGHPGTRPVLNKKVVEYATKLGLAMGSDIASELIFSRKSYFYPDMSKNFQTTQFEEPLCSHGSLQLTSGKKIGLTRIHIEEDPASVTYPSSAQKSSYSLIDYNRSGNPLVEIVTEPELETPEEARDFLKRLMTTLSYLKIFELNGGIIKADANVSVKESGYTRSEIKNITGAKEIELALAYEIERHKSVLADNGTIVKETRGWDANSKTTYSLRLKESEDDYGYIIEPDLVTIDITDAFKKEMKALIPELADAKQKRYIKDFGVAKDDAFVMAADLTLANLYEAVSKNVDPVLTAKWFRKELLSVLNYHKKTIEEISFGATEIIELFELIATREISDKTGKEILELFVTKGPFSAKDYVIKHNLQQMGGDDELREICKKVITNNAKAVDDYKSGNENSFRFLIGQVMKETKGKADPRLTSNIMKEELQ